jgi:hypothetical protein
MEEFKGGESLQEIARKHGRTLRAIEARLERLGLLTPEQRTTSSSFAGTSQGGSARSRPP